MTTTQLRKPPFWLFTRTLLDASLGLRERKWLRETRSYSSSNDSITLSGSSEYRLDGKAITFADYNKALANENILVKTKNFLVFQVGYHLGYDSS